MVWVIAAVMALIATWAILRAFMSAPKGTKAAELDVQVYKDQLASLDSDLERGVLTADEAAAAKLEISRRVLAADKRAQEEGVTTISTTSKPVLALVAVFLIGGSLGLYGIMGSPKLPDQPLQSRLEAAKQERLNRPNQVQAEAEVEPGPVTVDAEYSELIEKLRKTMQERPGDVEGWKLLALHEARTGNVRAAWRAKEKVIALLGDKSAGEDYAELAEYMIVATNGYVSVEAEKALASALKLDAKSPRARYYSGLALAQNGRPDVAYRMWVGLLEEGPEDAPWIPLIRGQIGAVARAAGLDVVDQDAPGPTVGDVEAANQMSEADRKAMISGMVAGLAERLSGEGGTAAEWARLIRAYGVLGETAKASEAWNDARAAYEGDAQAMSVLLEAARAAEVAN
jgi:cytochrome c-type biogenesis protein CcmH